MSSDRILPALSPGINVLTIHPRYWSFYSWVLDSFWKHDLRRTRAVFRDFYRPREALFSMACHTCDRPEHDTVTGNIVGSRRVSGLAPATEFDPAFDYIKEPLGGYGLYYRSAMEMTSALIVASPSNGFPFDAPTVVGKALAAAFGTAVEGTALGATLAADQVPESVTRKDLVDFARSACLCQLRVASKQDLPLLQDLFLHAGDAVEATARRSTMRFVLDLSQSAQDSEMGQVEFRQLIYFRELNGATYSPRKDLVDVARRWRIYQAREYFSFVFNRLFGWVVRRGLEETDDGLSSLLTARFWELLDGALTDHQFTSYAKLGTLKVTAQTTASAFIDALATRVGLDAGLHEIWPRKHVVNEHSLYEWCNNTEDDNETVVAMLALLLLVYRRIGTPARVADLAGDIDLYASGDSLRIGMARFFGLLHKKVMAGATLSDLAKWIVNDFVIVQHERVATTKLPDDTFRVRRVGDQLRFFVQEAPAQFNDSRFVALSSTVHELGFVSTLREAGRKLTPEGKMFLKDGDIAAGPLATAVQALESEQGAQP